MSRRCGLLVRRVTLGEPLVQRLDRCEARFARQPTNVTVSAKGYVVGKDVSLCHQHLFDRLRTVGVLVSR